MNTQNTTAEGTTGDNERGERSFASTFGAMFAAYDDEFRAAVAERGTPRAKALYAALQDSYQQNPARNARRCANQHSEG